MEGPSYEDISPSEGEVTEVPAVLPLLSEQELRRVLEDLQGENSGLELWEGERELTGVPPNLVQPVHHQEEKSEEAAPQEFAAKNLPKGELGDPVEEEEEDKSGTFGDITGRAEGPVPKDQKLEAKESEFKRTMGRVVKFKEKVEVLTEDEVSQREADTEAKASKFVKFREKREITTEEETTEEEEEENLARPSTSGMLLFSTLGGPSSRQQHVRREGEEEDEDGHTSGEGVGASNRRGARQPARKRKRRARREPGDVLKRGDMLEYLVEDGDDETWFKVEVMGKGKAKGRNRNYINLK